MHGKKKWWVLVIGSLLIWPGCLWAEQTEGQTFYASRLLDRDVFDSKEEKVGRVDDLVIQRNGKIRNMTLEVGGWIFGIGGKIVAYDFEDLLIETDRISVKKTKADLERRDEFSYAARGLQRGYFYGHYPRHTTPGYGPYRYGPYRYREPEYWSERGEPTWREEYPYPERPRRRHYPEVLYFSPARFLASVVIDRELIDSMGGRYGRIRDLVIDTDGKVRTIILEARVLGDDIHVELPYERIGFTPYGIVYEITLEELEKLPKHSYGG